MEEAEAAGRGGLRCAGVGGAPPKPSDGAARQRPPADPGLLPPSPLNKSRSGRGGQPRGRRGLQSPPPTAAGRDRSG